MFLSQARLRNFRGFVDVTLPLRPLTVILGPNSAGKSSFGHAIVGLRQAHRHAERTVPSLTPPEGVEPASDAWPVDLGSLSELRHAGSTGAIAIDLRVQTRDETYDCAFEFGGQSVLGEEMELTAIRGRAVRQQEAPTTATGIAGYPSQTIAAFPFQHLERPWEVAFSRTKRSPWADELKGQSVDLQFGGVALERAFHKTGTQVPIASEGFRLLASALDEVQYLRPARLTPGRAYGRSAAPPKTVGHDGEFTADFIWEHRDAPVRIFSPPSVPIRRSEVTLNAPWTENATNLLGAIDQWLQHLELGRGAHSALASDGRRVRLDLDVGPEGRRALTDVGFGVSQVLPVLAMGATLKPEALLVVELPEAHLHPRAQAALADFFCAVVLAGGRLLLETHSEALFHRLRLWAALDDRLADAMGVWLLDSPVDDGRCAQPSWLDLTDELRWPTGFLTQGTEAELSIALAREARERLEPKQGNREA